VKVLKVWNPSTDKEEWAHAPCFAGECFGDAQAAAEYFAEHRDGTNQWVWATPVNVRTDDGELHRFMVYAHQEIVFRAERIGP